VSCHHPDRLSAKDRRDPPIDPSPAVQPDANEGDPEARLTATPAYSATHRVASFPAAHGRHVARIRVRCLPSQGRSVQPCRLTISWIQIGANGDVQPFDTG